ncbi:hypothetical protein [Methanobrevibacter sp.]|uniref:hypothetical protein n=1 Tax=Methanobrevibacter sp. TaxID=66852 RepID=UPI00388E0DBD
MNKKTLRILGALIILICALTAVTAVSSTSDDNNSENANITLQINTTGSWRLDLTVDGNYSSCEAEGSKTIDLNSTEIDFASVTINQKNGPTDVFLVKGNETLHEEHSKSSGIETIYFFYPEK